MLINQGNNNDSESLVNIQDELNFLLSQVKPEDNLKVGDIFKLKKNIKIPGHGELEKGLKVEIIDIEIPVENNLTTQISYKVKGKKQEDVLKMSKGVFILYFCDDIRLEQDNLDKRLKILKGKEEKLKKELKLEETRENFVEEVKWLLRLTKFFRKRAKK